MTLKEILSGQGLTDEQIETISAAMKENKIYTSGEENIDIRYGKLKEDFASKTKEHEDAQALIKQLQEATKNDETIQNQIKDYETQIAALKADAEKAKLSFELKANLLEKNVNPESIDFLMFKIEQENKELKLNEQGKLDGLDFEELKTKYATHFKGEAGGTGEKRFESNPLPDGSKKENEPTSLADALKAKYETKD